MFRVWLFVNATTDSSNFETNSSLLIFVMLSVAILRVEGENGRIQSLWVW